LDAEIVGGVGRVHNIRILERLLGAVAEKTESRSPWDENKGDAYFSKRK
jgi:hypothetical protein